MLDKASKYKGLLILVVIGIVGWWIWKNRNKTDDQKNADGGGSGFKPEVFPLAFGMKGDKITFIQEKLNEVVAKDAKYRNKQLKPIDVDGKWGDVTNKRLKLVFQRTTVDEAFFKKIQGINYTSKNTTSDLVSGDGVAANATDADLVDQFHKAMYSGLFELSFDKPKLNKLALQVGGVQRYRTLEALYVQRHPSPYLPMSQKIKMVMTPSELAVFNANIGK